MVRRHAFDPLERSEEPRWYVVRSMHNAILEVRLLAAGSDLKRAFIAAMLEWIDAGWEIAEFSSRAGVFFCARGVERRMVEISPTDHGPARSSGSPDRLR
jgi:hypothetical protein